MPTYKYTGRWYCPRCGHQNEAEVSIAPPERDVGIMGPWVDDVEFEQCEGKHCRYDPSKSSIQKAALIDALEDEWIEGFVLSLEPEYD